MRKRYCDAYPPISIKKKNGKTKKGNAGLQIGLIKLLWRRGHINPSFPKLPADYKARAMTKMYFAS